MGSIITLKTDVVWHFTTGIMLGIAVTGSEDLTLSSLTVCVDRIFNS